jgi:opacity protein-like surface antigen
MRTGALVGIVLLGIALAGSAAAGDFDRFGPYVEAGGSYATALWEDPLENEIDVSVDVDDGIGANGRVGLRIFSGLAVEAQYEWISPYDVSIAGVDSFDVETHVLTANAKLLMPWWRLQPYLLAGVGFADAKLEDKLGLGLSEHETQLAARGALGFDLYLTEHIALFAEGGVVVIDQKIDTGLPGTDPIDPVLYTGAQAGLMFRF